MKNFQIGKSGIEVPFLGMGTWAIGGGAWWGDNDDSLSVKAIQTAVEPHWGFHCSTSLRKRESVSRKPLCGATPCAAAFFE